MHRKLDKIDRKILVELDTNARESFSEIGKKLAIGHNNVQYRVKRLVEDGVIKKFVTQFSLGTLGVFMGKFYIALGGLSNEAEIELTDFVLKDKRVGWFVKCEGRWDILVACYVDSLKQLDSFKKDFFHKYERYVTSYDVVFGVEAHVSQRTYLLDKKLRTDKVKYFIGDKPVALDETDKKIMRIIANDARFGYLDVARKVGLNIKTLQKRIKTLEDQQVIQGYISCFDPTKTGYMFFKMCIYLHNYQNKLDSFISYCLELPNVIHVIESLGPWEVEIELEAESMQDFYDISRQIRNKHADIVKKIESVVISKEVKVDFFPEWY